MGEVNHDNASEAGHGLKLSERIEVTAEAARNFYQNFYWRIVAFPHREKTMVPLPSAPAFQHWFVDNKQVQLVVGKDSKGNLIKTWEVHVVINKMGDRPTYSPVP